MVLFACSPITSGDVANDADPAALDSAVAVVDAGRPDATTILQGDLGGACFNDMTCKGGLTCNDQQICYSCVPSKIIYLNREGGTYTKGSDDSRTNTTSVIAAGGPDTATLSARTITDSVWNQLLIDTRENFAAYDVDVVDQDPGNVEHLEIVLTDSLASAIGYQGGILGLSPGCSSEFSLIGFMFGETLPSPPTLASFFASRAALTAGLSYVTECNDAMSYTPLSCIVPTFTDAPLTCGQAAAIPCRCNTAASTQNSHQELLSKFGARVCD